VNTLLILIVGSFILAAIFATHTHHNPRVNVETLPGIVGRFLFARFLDGRRSIRELDARMAIALPAERDELTEPPPAEHEGHQIGNRWPARQTPTDLAAAYEPVPIQAYVQPRELVSTAEVVYVGRHRAGERRVDVTAEFRAIVRSVVFDEDLVDVT
jgi:hypothetical protein